MSTTTQEQNHLQSEEQNPSDTNFVKNEKSEANETNLIKEDNHVSDNIKKEHDEPKQDQQMPDQSGTSLTKNNNPDTQNEKLPESEPFENIEQQQPKEESPHKEENEVTPKAHPENKEEENVEKDNHLPVSQNLEIQQDQNPDTDHQEPLEKNTPKHENLETVHKDESKEGVKPDDEHQEKLTPREGHQPSNQEEKPLENDNTQPSSQQNHDESLENQNPQDRTNENAEEMPEKILEEKPLSNAESPAVAETTPQEELAENIGSIFNFFSITKDNLAQSADQAVTKLGDMISKSRLASVIQGNEYTSVITSDHVKQQEPAPISTTNRRKSSQADQTPKLLNESIENPLKIVKSPKKTILPNKTPKGADSKTLLVNDKSLSKLQPPKQPDFKNRNEIEEQIRQHKIQEIIKQKKALEMKLGSLNEQLVELQKVELSSSPNRSKSKPKESREEFLQRKKKAVEFAKKMHQEQKNIEIRNDQRREARQVLVNKEIEALQQLADKKYERKKIMDFIKGQTEVVQKAKHDLSSLEEKKLELKQKREFDKDIDHVNTRDPSEHEPPHKLASKSSSKKLYKSPMLPQVLAHDAEVKKVESEKVQKRKALHDKQVEYGRGVKDIFLPKVQSKFEARKLKMGVYKSQQVETHLLRSGKDGLYGYLDKMKNEFEGPKHKKKPMKHREEPVHHPNDDEDLDTPPTDFVDEEEQNVNVAYGKQLVYELQDNWNLADGTLSSRMMSNKNQQNLKKNLSPRNPEVNPKYTIKHKKEKELMIDGNHLSGTEQGVNAKITEPRYEDDEDY